MCKKRRKIFGQEKEEELRNKMADVPWFVVMVLLCAEAYFFLKRKEKDERNCYSMCLGVQSQEVVYCFCGSIVPK